MKIRQRLALRFTLVSALLTGAILVFTYIITKRVVHSDFLERLAQQSRIEAIHYATPDVKDVLTPGEYLLVDPNVSIYSEDGGLLMQHGNSSIPGSWVGALKTHQEFNAERNGFTTVGRKYTYQDTTYLVFVTARDVSAHHELEILMKTMVTGWFASLVLSYLAGLYFSEDALKPVKHVVKDVNKITEDNLSYRLKLEKDLSQLDEIDELITTFNALLNRIEGAFVAQKRFVQHASHELKTPLTAIMAEAELALSRDRHPDDYKRTLEVVLTETERLVSITHGLLTLARVEEGSFKTELDFVELTELTSRVIESVRTRYRDREILFHAATAISLYVYGNRQLLEVALTNVIDNALKYSTAPVTVEIRKHDETIVVMIVDKGIGIPQSELEKIRLPLYRASNVRSKPGAGLGLSLVDRIMHALDGKLDIASEEGVGTKTMLTLPATKPPGRADS